MKYRLIKSINNNVVLVSRPDEAENSILMAKGIGFNRKVGDNISDDLNGQEVIKFFSSGNQIKSESYDKNEVKEVVGNIAKLAQEKLSIKNKDFYHGLLDHICFAIDRLQFGIPIENPFINEISIFYADEYKMAQKAIKMIQEKINVNMGDDEAGFIALHFHSARDNKPVSAYIKNVRILNEVVEIVSSALGKGVKENSQATRVFILSVSGIINSGAKQSLIMPKECNIAQGMSQSRAIAIKVKQFVESETSIHFSDGDIDFITVNIEQLRQQIN